MSYPYIIQGKNIVVVIDNKPFQIGQTHIAYEKIKQAIKDSDWETVKDSVEPKEVIVQYAQGNIKIDGNKLLWKDEEMHGALASRLIEMYKEGFAIAPLELFIANLLENPSKRAVDELYGFLEKNTLPLTDDGCFLAYKKVRGDYKDVYSGTIDNSVGQNVSMPRNKVNDNKDQTCSDGLHFCSIDYLAHFGGERIVILKINPRDVVSIPTDYNNAKGRCCAYYVIGEVENVQQPEKAFTAAVDITYKESNKSRNFATRPVSGLFKNGNRWCRSNGTFASRAEIDAHLRAGGDGNVRNTPVGPMKQNSRGQWIWCATGTYVPKQYLP
jgi:hypothetical protein